MKLLVALLVCLAIACKPQEKNQQQTVLEPANQLPKQSKEALATEYTPNPDEVVLFLTFIESKKTEKGWENKVKVKKQMRAGFGFKDRLLIGSTILLRSNEEIPAGDFYCAAEYSGIPEDSYFLKLLLED